MTATAEYYIILFSKTVLKELKSASDRNLTVNDNAGYVHLVVNYNKVSLESLADLTSVGKSNCS